MIAHRLETAVKHSDKVLVMNHGSVAEFDHSFKLLVKEPDNYLEAEDVARGDGGIELPSDPTADTIFSSMVRATPRNQREKIMRLAH